MPQYAEMIDDVCTPLIDAFTSKKKMHSQQDARHDQLFRKKVDDALQAVKRILDLHRNPQLAGEVDHEYGDKYSLVDQMTNMALIGQVNALARLGLTANILESFDKSKSVTLRFQASESCIFLKEQTVEVPDTKSDEITFGSSLLGIIKRVMHHEKEYHWFVAVNWTISVYVGTKDEDKMILSSRSSSMILVTQSHNGAPLPENRECKPLDVSLNWLMKNIDTDAMASIFHVDTQSPETKTPRRNLQVEDALSFMRDLSSWTTGVRAYFNVYVQQHIVDKHNPVSSVPRPNPEERLTRLGDDTFVPVQPLFEDGDNGSTNIDVDSTLPSESILSLPPQHDDEEDAHGSSVLLSTDDMYKFLNEQIRTLQARLDVLGRTYPASSQSDKVISVAEASMVLISLHCEGMVSSYMGGVGYVEQMLEDQLVSAIGKRIDVSDIDQFLRYHNARLLPPPQPFCHAIRQPEHYPCGILSIEGVQNDGKRNPIETLVREVDSVPSIILTLNAATSVELTGKVFLHGWIQHRFGMSRVVPELIARARQFSSFMLVVGTMSGSDQMDPKDAIILQNKDELIIPLILDEIPTAKEFKDAIRSMSPEQQRFAQAFRKMQLGSSVLGISVIQIKPQLEALLGLPCGSLTKEMKLMQDLMELFVEYQVPSDLLSYDGIDSSAGRKEKVDNVRSHVEAVSRVIDEAKARELKEHSMKAEMSKWARSDLDYDWSSDRPADVLWKKEEPVFSWSGCRPDALSAVPRPSGDFCPDGNWEAPVSSPLSEFNMRSADDSIQLTSHGGDSARPADSVGPEQPTQQLVTCSDNHAPLASATPDHGAMDFAAVPRILDSAIERYAQGASLRSTTITLGDSWIRNRQDNLLAKAPTKSNLQPDDLKQERNKAMDLLDALSRSGSLPISFSELHVIVSVTHCFEKDVIETIIQDNINPIEKLENTTMLVGSAIYGVPASGLISNREDLQRLKLSFPVLLDEQKDSST